MAKASKRREREASREFHMYFNILSHYFHSDTAHDPGPGTKAAEGPPWAGPLPAAIEA